MSSYSDISEEQLHAFVDNQLDGAERARILDAMQHDRELAERIARIQQLKDMTMLAYQELPAYKPSVEVSPRAPGWFSAGIAASLLFVFSVMLGWTGHTYLVGNNTPTFERIAQFDPKHTNKNRILLHINTNDKKRIESVLDTTEELLKTRKDQREPLELEVVANATGISMLRDGSPYRKRIQSILDKHNNVAFYACGHAMENASLKEGSEIRLIPEATRVDAALEQILKRLKMGWTYIRA